MTLSTQVLERMKISNEVLGVALAAFIAMQGYLVMTTSENSSAIRSVDRAVNNVGRSEPTLRALVVNVDNDLDKLDTKFDDEFDDVKEKINTLTVEIERIKMKVGIEEDG